MLIIGLTGLAGAGKTTVADYLKEKHGFVKLTFSDILLKEALKRGLLKEVKSKDEERVKIVLSKLGDKMRKESGKMGILAELLCKEIKEKRLEKVCVDGFRSPEEVILFKKEFGNDFILIKVYASESVRVERLKRRDPSINIEKLKERDKRDLKLKGLEETLKMADLELNNDCSLKELYERVDNLLKSLKR